MIDMDLKKELMFYNKWLMEVWNPNQLHIPFANDAPGAYIKYLTTKKEPKNKVCEHPNDKLIHKDDFIYCCKCDEYIGTNN